MYGRLIHALLRRDQFEDAVAKLTEMKDAGIPQSTHMYSLPNTPYIVFLCALCVFFLHFLMCSMSLIAFFCVLYAIKNDIEHMKKYNL
jgi:pentatricopeptide repeat protein